MNARLTVTMVPSAAVIMIASVMPSSACAAMSSRSSLSRRSVTSRDTSTRRCGASARPAADRLHARLVLAHAALAVDQAQRHLARLAGRRGAQHADARALGIVGMQRARRRRRPARGRAASSTALVRRAGVEPAALAVDHRDQVARVLGDQAVALLARAQRARAARAASAGAPRSRPGPSTAASRRSTARSPGRPSRRVVDAGATVAHSTAPATVQASDHATPCAPSSPPRR